MSRRRNTGSDSATTFIMMCLLAIVALPIVGICLMSSKDPAKRPWGVVLLIAGIAIWIAIGVNS